ncbi:MAG TPA: deoxynucleoside kinase, partial [Pyrinomonadaceae bacterium]|nr:deoxynucleoside kinase [Pyrinomonadaceae bacterium]
MRIEICGAIGAGKTTLAGVLKSNSFVCVTESFRLNPFWSLYFSNPDKFSFETELTFILLHYHQIKLLADNPLPLVCDFSLIQDLAYAMDALAGKRLDIFESIFDEALTEVGPPDLVVCLQCRPEALLERI